MALLFVTLVAQITHLVFQDAARTAEQGPALETVRVKNDFPWQWTTKDLKCQKFDCCVKIDVDNTHRCKGQLAIDVSISDIKDNWGANVSMVTESPKSVLPSTIEVGVNTIDSVSFLFGEVTCTHSVSSETAERLTEDHDIVVFPSPWASC